METTYTLQQVLLSIPRGHSFHPRCPAKMDICSRIDLAMTSETNAYCVRGHLYSGRD